MPRPWSCRFEPVGRIGFVLRVKALLPRIRTAQQLQAKYRYLSSLLLMASGRVGCRASLSCTSYLRLVSVRVDCWLVGLPHGNLRIHTVQPLQQTGTRPIRQLGLGMTLDAGKGKGTNKERHNRWPRIQSFISSPSPNFPKHTIFILFCTLAVPRQSPVSRHYSHLAAFESLYL